jgi:cell division protein FtsN
MSRQNEGGGLAWNALGLVTVAVGSALIGAVFLGPRFSRRGEPSEYRAAPSIPARLSPAATPAQEAPLMPGGETPVAAAEPEPSRSEADALDRVPEEGEDVPEVRIHDAGQPETAPRPPRERRSERAAEPDRPGREVAEAAVEPSKPRRRERRREQDRPRGGPAREETPAPVEAPAGEAQPPVVAAAPAAPPAAESEEATVYRVRVGRFAAREEAERIRERVARASGGDVSLIRVRGAWRVQVGAFRERGTADRVTEALRTHALEADVTEGKAALRKPSEPRP